MAIESNTQLDALSADMDKSLRSARAGATLTTILAIASVGLIGFYLVYAHNKFIEIATPETVAKNAAFQLRERAPEYARSISAKAKEAAPGVLDRVEAQLNEVPDRLAQQLSDRSGAELKAIMPRAEEEMYKTLKQALDEQKAKRDKNVSDEAFAKATIDVLASTYGDESIKLLEQVHGQYAETSGDMLTYLQKLADDKSLTRKESLQRQALVTFLTIASRTQKSQG